MNYYKTIQNLIDCGLATKEELVKACAEHSYKTGKELPEPKEYWYCNGERFTISNITSPDYKFYLLVELMVRVINNRQNSNVTRETLRNI